MVILSQGDNSPDSKIKKFFIVVSSSLANSTSFDLDTFVIPLNGVFKSSFSFITECSSR